MERRGSSRRIVGAFQFSAVVQTRAGILPVVERSLVNLRRVVGTIPHENRWYPAMHRSLSQVDVRIKALGGHDENDARHGPKEGRGEHEEHDREHGREHDGDRREERPRFESKIAGLSFDSFGDFEGFWLKNGDNLRRFYSCERVMEVVVSKAWLQQIALPVITEEYEPRSVVLLRVLLND